MNSHQLHIWAHFQPVLTCLHDTWNLPPTPHAWTLPSEAPHLCTGYTHLPHFSQWHWVFPGARWPAVWYLGTATKGMELHTYSIPPLFSHRHITTPTKAPLTISPSVWAFGSHTMPSSPATWFSLYNLSPVCFIPHRSQTHIWAITLILLHFHHPLTSLC